MVKTKMLRNALVEGENRKKWDAGEKKLDNISDKIAFELDFFHECINFMSGHADPSLLLFYPAAFGR